MGLLSYDSSFISFFHLLVLRKLNKIIVKGVAQKLKERDISILIITTITVLTLFVYNSQTDTGIAIKKEMKDIFSPEKVVKQSIEGMDEEIQMKLNEGNRS